MAVSIGVSSFISEDFVALARFYEETFELAEVAALRSDIFRGFDVDGVTLGFHAPDAYALLGIEAWRDARGTTSLLLFEAESDEGVDAYTARAVANGGRVLHDAYLTYYHAYQTVLEDPDGNVFRINHFHV
jgi:predicted enzyme related to lactoylglutathione lyase